MSDHKLLTEEKKQYILANYKKMSARGIAKKLDVSRKSVEKYIKEIQSKKIKPIPGSKYIAPSIIFNPKTAALIAKILFVIILVFAFNLRKHTFNLPHMRGDQHHYVGLAFKLDKYGFSGYNLKGIDIVRVKDSSYLLAIKPARDKGYILKSMESQNIFYYDEPWHHIPFGFPVAIMLSHKIFAHNQPYYLLQIEDLIEVLRRYPPGEGLKNFRFNPAVASKQVFSVIIPLSFSMLLIILVYFLGRHIYKSEFIALSAMLLMAIAPIDILSAQKIWADDMTAALTLLAILLYILAVDKKRPSLALLGGISCGLSAITKQNGAFIIFAIIIWHFLANRKDLFNRKTFLKTLFDKNLIIFGLGALLGSGYWFFKVISFYGNPFYMPHQENIAKVAKIGWFSAVGNRPRYLYLAGIPYQNPLFVLAYISPLYLWQDKKHSKNSLLLILWVAVFLYLFSVYLGGGGKEHRYMLPSYAAFAILGAYVANMWRILIDKKIGFYIGTILFIIALISSALWSVPIGMRAALHTDALIAVPF